MQRLKKNIKRCIKWSIRSVGFVLVAAFLINGYVLWKYADRIISVEAAQEKKVDCILVLGASVWGGTRPSPILQDRLDRGIELYELGVSDRLLMSGDHGGQYYDEVNVMKKYAIEQGVESRVIFMDHAGFSTYESMVRAKEIFEVETVLVVTQKYHLSRAVYIGNTLGMETYGVPAEEKRYSRQLQRDIREVAARVKDFFFAWIQPHPTYEGDAIPIYGNGDVTND